MKTLNCNICSILDIQARDLPETFKQAIHGLHTYQDQESQEHLYSFIGNSREENQHQYEFPEETLDLLDQIHEEMDYHDCAYFRIVDWEMQK